MQLPPDWVATLDDHIAQGNIRPVNHPAFPLTIYNYTPQVQYGRLWDEVTMMCRGLILDAEHNIVARPFTKFFNWGEWDEDKQARYATEPHRVYEKLDGSLGILYRWEDRWWIATRGSFTSEQARMGQTLLDQTVTTAIPTEGVTPLVEIIYPENRIVVNYGDRTELVFLAAISHSTGHRLSAPWWHGPRATSYHATLDDVLTVPEDITDEEGFVVVFGDGEQAKIKLTEYTRLHRILTGTNARMIWEALQEPVLWDALIDRVPDEFVDWVRATELALRTDYLQIEYAAKSAFQENVHLAAVSRKEFALWATTTPYADILFAMLDERDFAPLIWKRIKPEPTKPFREET